MIVVDKSNDQFPVGMRVLAVDDDPICLRVLDTLLRKCQYHVTTTNQAITAVNLLRENKNQFDLVISDVHMPDMDGFKLLELVGLEMDLPVIMLSANGDTKLVMKGITHGACDYLLKPVRIEELKNIWQHVIRRKKNDQKNQREVEDGQGYCGPTRFSDQNSKLINRKRKDQDGDDDDEDDENVENGYADDTLNQKKPRVVWTVDLHRKFVSAVNHLGIDKAVPKKVLDLMNVEKLTRENVASHLQKYRLYLRRISHHHHHHHQANMPTDSGSFDSPFLRMTSLTGPPWLHNPAAGLVQFGHNTLVPPMGQGQQPLDIQKGILGISHPSDFSGSFVDNNWQTQIQPSMAMIGSGSHIVDKNLNSSVLTQGWDIGGGLDNTSNQQLNLSRSGFIDPTTMIQGTESNNTLVFDCGNNDFRCFGDPLSIMSHNDILQPSSHRHSSVMDQRRTPQNGYSSYANNTNNNVGSLEDLIRPIINQVSNKI